jgi:hypothetical protein
MKIIKNLALIWILLIILNGCHKENSWLNVEVVQDENLETVNIFVEGKLFTAYRYTDKISNLKKPVLFPIIAADGAIITRGFPLEPRPGERIDHPHHIGCWLNYGDVNGIDFWGYSDATPAEQHDRMGTIRHRAIRKAESGKQGILEVTMDWLKADGSVMLKEETRFVFLADQNRRIIDRLTKLTAQDEKIVFNDTKEGMYAIRVNRALELPSDQPVVLSDAHGQKTDVPVLDNTGVTGDYLSSEGVKGLDTWGKRAKWVALSGEIDGKKETVVIFDNPGNPGYPAYWHSRGYGLFSINPLGVRTFTEGKQSLDLTLRPGDSVMFKYRILVKSGAADADEIEKDYQSFVSEDPQL